MPRSPPDFRRGFFSASPCPPDLARRPRSRHSAERPTTSSRRLRDRLPPANRLLLGVFDGLHRVVHDRRRHEAGRERAQIHMATPAEVSRSKQIKHIDCQTGLKAPADSKGISGAVANLARRHAQRRLVARRHRVARPGPKDGLHGLRPDRRRRPTGLDAERRGMVARTATSSKSLR